MVGEIPEEFLGSVFVGGMVDNFVVVERKES